MAPFILLALAFAFRWPSLTAHSLWSDEISIWLEINVPSFLDMLKYHLAHDYNPVGFPVMQYFYSKLFNDPILGLRTFSLLGSLLTTLAAYYLAVEISLSKAAKFLLAISLVLNYQLVYFSHESRAYAWMLTFSLSSCIFYLRFIKSINLKKSFSNQFKALYKNKDFYLFFISLTCMAYMHYFGTFAMACFLLHFLAVYGKNKTGISIFLLLSALSFVFYLPQFYIAVNAVRTVGKLWIPPVNILDLLSYTRWYFGGASVTTLLCAATVYFAISRYGVWEKKSDLIIFLLSLFLGTYLIGYTVSELYIPIMYSRYMIIGLIPFLFIFIICWDAIYLKLKAKQQKIFFIVFCLYFTGQSLDTLFRKTNFYANPKSEQLKEAAEYVLENNNRELTTVYSNGAIVIDKFYFEYFKANEVKIIIAPTSKKAEDDKAFRESLKDDSQKYFFIDYGDSDIMKQIPDFLRIEEEKRFYRVRVFKLERKLKST